MFDPQQPRRLQPTRLLRPFGIFQAKVLEWGAIAFSVNDERLLLGEIHGYVPAYLWPQDFHQLISTEPYFIVFLLFNIYRCFINTEPTADSTRAHACTQLT